MVLSEGKNNYENNEFSFWEWSAPILQTPEEVMQKVNELKLIGRKIRNIYAVGMGYNWCDYEIESLICETVKEKEPKVNLQSFLPEGIYVPRWAEIDEPLLIEFYDGDILGVDFSEGSCVRLELNTIPKHIEPGVNRKTFHANKLFEKVINKTIKAVEVVSTTEMPDFTGSHGLELKKQISYISKIYFWVDDKNYYSYERIALEFFPFVDYGHIYLCDNYMNTIKIHAPDIKEVVKGYIDNEILDGEVTTD